jgi:DNA-binding winged helix-turn-helix (wHTH) protein
MRVSFFDCLFDPNTREVFRDGKPISLSPKAFRLLEILIQRRPGAVSKEELHRLLWQETFVSDANLSNLMAELRAALGDDARAQRIFRTVPRYGYSFCADAAALAGARGHTAPACRLIWGDREVALVAGENLLGRDSDVAIWVDLSSVSRRHARIVVSDGIAMLEDLGSRNGTYVGDKKVTEPVQLANGDQIKMGSARLLFRSFGSVGTTESEVREDSK